MSRKSITFVAAAALSLAASAVFASPFPWTVNEAGFDNPAAMAYARQHLPSVVRTDGSSFPRTANEAGFDNPAAMAYAEQHPVKVARISGSPFPWTVNEAGPYVAESGEMTQSPSAVHTAGK